MLETVVTDGLGLLTNGRVLESGVVPLGVELKSPSVENEGGVTEEPPNGVDCVNGELDPGLTDDGE